MLKVQSDQIKDEEV